MERENQFTNISRRNDKNFSEKGAQVKKGGLRMVSWSARGAKGRCEEYQANRLSFSLKKRVDK